MTDYSWRKDDCEVIIDVLVIVEGLYPTTTPMKSFLKQESWFTRPSQSLLAFFFSNVNTLAIYLNRE